MSPLSNRHESTDKVMMVLVFHVPASCPIHTRLTTQSTHDVPSHPPSLSICYSCMHACVLLRHQCRLSSFHYNTSHATDGYHDIVEPRFFVLPFFMSSFLFAPHTHKRHQKLPRSLQPPCFIVAHSKSWYRTTCQSVEERQVSREESTMAGRQPHRHAWSKKQEQPGVLCSTAPLSGTKYYKNQYQFCYGTRTHQREEKLITFSMLCCRLPCRIVMLCVSVIWGRALWCYRRYCSADDDVK